MSRFFNFIIALTISLGASSIVPQTNIYFKEGLTFYQLEGDVIVTHDLSNQVGEVYMSDLNNELEILAQDIDRIEIVNKSIPKLIINTPDFPNLYQLVEKEVYLNATIEIDGNGYIDDMDVSQALIKGRGNSTWGMPKKPMRLKFPKKISLAGLKESKNFVLLANYIDPTLMRNAIAMKIAQLLGIKCANHIVPCDVIFNGHPLGNFMLTEKIGINSSSVDINEEQGILFELSTEYDETYKFKSTIYGLPVMVKDPDFNELANDSPELGSAETLFDAWKNDFNNAERIASAGHAEEAFDISSFVDYVLLYDLCGNHEIGFPKSMYIYKEIIGENTLYKAGPPWDFDAAFNLCVFKDGEFVLSSHETRLWINPLLDDIASTSAFKELYRNRLIEYRDELFPLLLQYIDEYTTAITPSAKINGLLWEASDLSWVYALNSFNHEEHISCLRQWLIDRLNFLIEYHKL